MAFGVRVCARVIIDNHRNEKELYETAETRSFFLIKFCHVFEKNCSVIFLFMVWKNFIFFSAA